jgi:N-acetylglucosaminyl-diphospho-decaprenol L-rhamnosyltransferase
VKTNIIILNYNGEKLLPICLPSIIEAKRRSVHAVRITVIDNQSADRGLEVLNSFCEEISVLKRSNRVFCSYNDVVRDQSEDIAILLNNDIRVSPNFIDPMVEVLMKNEDAFMVAPKCYDFDGYQIEGGRSKGFIRYGWFGAMARYPGWEREQDKPGYTFQTGFGAVRRDRFLELGGYDDLYLPGRLEDADVCFRAWKRGWKCYYEPRSIVYHMGGASFGDKFGKGGISTIDSRNSALFFWKNIQYPGYWAMHFIFIPVRMVWWLLRGDFAAVKGLFQAFGRIPKVLRRRFELKKMPQKLKDREVFEQFL